MISKIQLLVLVKSVDGGTGTFLINFLKLKEMFPQNQFVIDTIILEQPSYRNFSKFNFGYLRKKNYYPQKYSFSPVNIINFIEELFYLRQKIIHFNPTIILGIDLRCNLLAIILKLLFFKRIKVIATNHIDLNNTISGKSTIYLNFILRKFINYFYSKSDVIVCVSKQLSQALQAYFKIPNEVITIYNGIDIKPNSIHPKQSNKTKIIITIARLVEQKDHINLIKAFEIVQKEVSNSELWIVSDGPLKNQLEAYVRNRRLENRIKLLGWVKSIYTYLNRADVFVLSSKREGFAYVLIEAMSQGLPVVATDTPYGPREVLDHGKYGFLVPMQDPFSMARAISTLLTDKTIYQHYAQKSLERIRFFTTKNMIKNYQKIITNLYQTQ